MSERRGMTGTSPGGRPHVSSAKKRRLAELKSSLADQQRSDHEGLQSTGPQASKKAPGGKTHRGSGKASTSAFPYIALPENFMDGSLSRHLKPCEGRDHPDGGSDQQTSSLQTFVEELLSTNKSQTSDSRTAASTRVIDKTILLDNPTKQAGAGVQAGLVRPKHAGYCLKLDPKLHKDGRRSIVDILKDPTRRGRSSVSYESLMPLHAMWNNYMSGLIGDSRGQDGILRSSQGGTGIKQQPDSRLLAHADLHGCLMAVVSCPEVRNSGIEGVVAAVTPQVVCLVTAEDRLHVVLKRGSRFKYRVPGDFMVTVDGDTM